MAALILAACSAPAIVKEQASQTLSPSCLALFDSQRYQEPSQNLIGGTPVMAISVGRINGLRDVICYVGFGGSIATSLEQRRSLALQLCEKRRENILTSNKNGAYEPCTTFSEGNKIIYKPNL
jgi:hypothetical protein